MNKFNDKFKRSSFIVNKIYLFLIFLFLTITDFTLGFVYFLISVFIYLWKTITSKVPMEADCEIDVKTFIYRATEDRELKLDLYMPLYVAEGNHPLVYFCHGGGWISGFRNQPNNISWCKYLACKGFIVSSIDYRYGYKNSMDDILSDYTEGLKFLKDRSEELTIDKDNIVLMGLSAGGHLSLLYAAYNTFQNHQDKIDGVKAVIGYYAPSNLADIFVSDNKSLFAKFAASSTLKGLPTNAREIYDYYSPINWVSERMIPTLLVHGKLDNTVPFNSSVEMVKKLKKNGIPTEFFVHKHADHSFDTKLNDLTTINILEKTVRYIRKSLSGDN